VDEARHRLGLGETATLDEIKQAYHRLAGQLHPDHNPENLEAEAPMAELTQAYELLTAYAETVQECRGAQGQEGARKLPCTFSQEAVEQTLLIAIRRQEIPASPD
jgi:hypothetical protein